MSGSVIPFAGIRFTEDAMCMDACTANCIISPAPANKLNRLGPEAERSKPLNRKKLYKPITNKHANTPYSSAATEKIKSACASGKFNFT